MYDPTIFDNLKVVVEGGLYDMERDGQIRLLSRQDLIDLASMGRKFSMGFQLANHSGWLAQIELISELADFAAELARLRIVEPSGSGCQLQLSFWFGGGLRDVEQRKAISEMLHGLWSDEITIQHRFEQIYSLTEKAGDKHMSYTIDVHFVQKINEQHMESLPELLHQMMVSLQNLALYLKKP